MILPTNDGTRRYTVALLLTMSAWAWTAPRVLAQAAPTPPPLGVAFVVTTDFSTGSYAVIDLATLTPFNDLNPGGIHSDAIARYDSTTARVYVVNRLGADSIQVVDPQQGFITPPGAELSMGNGSNPQDIAVLSPDKAYVSRTNATSLLVINPTTLTEVGTVELGSLTKSNDLDGLPDMYRMLLHDGLLYVIMQHFDQTNNFQPVGAGEIAVIDTATDTVVGVIALRTPNPFSHLQFTAALPQGPRILVSAANTFAVGDGGIEAIDPVRQTVDAAFVADETTLGGNISHFEVVSATKAYATVGFFVADGSFSNALISFNPSTGMLLETLADNLASAPNFALSNAGALYLGETNLTTPTPGVRIFDTALDAEITAAPLNVGALPPNWVVMVEAPQVALTVHKAGSGIGAVTAAPAGLDCGPVCTRRYPVGTTVTLTATPAPGGTFAGWQGGGCTGTAPCAMLLEQDLAVVAIFQ